MENYNSITNYQFSFIMYYLKWEKFHKITIRNK